MATVAKTIQGRMFAASACAYEVDLNGNYVPAEPYHSAVGWTAPPTAVKGGLLNIDAALIGANPDGIVIAFRGTLPPAVTIPSILDWWQGIYEVPPMKAGAIPGQVHSGFWAALNSVWPQIETAYAALATANPEAKLIITGHSKGGAMATLAAAHIRFNGAPLKQPSAVYTFGSARPGDSAFASAFPVKEIPVTRYENYLDIIPLLPPDAAFIKLLSDVPNIGQHFHAAAKWNYVPLGTLQYIEKNHNVVPKLLFLDVVRVGEIIVQLAMGQAGFNSVVAAHETTFGRGYQKGVAPDIEAVK